MSPRLCRPPCPVCGGSEAWPLQRPSRQRTGHSVPMCPWHVLLGEGKQPPRLSFPDVQGPLGKVGSVGTWAAAGLQGMG